MQLKQMKEFTALSMTTRTNGAGISIMSLFLAEREHHGSGGKVWYREDLCGHPKCGTGGQRDILRICSESSCELMNLPGMYQLYTGEVAISKMKPVQIEDLLGRDPIRPDMKEVYEYIEGKVVLITGVGSIGSELARQIASHHPKHLILFDIYENNAYDIQLELKKKYPNLKLNTIIGSVRDSRKIFDLFEQYRPEIVYHAAAHKHVPLMEDSPCEAVKNNAMGTYKTAYAAMAHGCKRFGAISMDSARTRQILWEPPNASVK